jgi:hypothetical protein
VTPLEILAWAFMGACWGWCLRAMGEQPAPKPCGHDPRVITLGAGLLRQVESVHFKMACVGVGEHGGGFIVEETASITMPGKAKLSMTLRGETA